MNNQILERAKKLSEEIKKHDRNIKILELACSDDYREREMLLFISGIYSINGEYETKIPVEVMKSICKIALLQSRENRMKLKDEFDNL